MPYKILITDDSPITRKLLLKILENKGYDLIEAVDGEDAIETCLNEIPDLMLLDISMPKKDGYEVCSTIKADSRTRDIPVIFLSANTDTADKIRGLELGAVDYITKPFSKGEVLARVKTQLKIHLLTQSLVRANTQLSERQKALDEDLQAAAQIQKSLIPKEVPKTENFSFAWRFMPCEQVGGDIFNIHRLNDAHLSAYVLDVSGHGVPSAMVTVSVSQTLLPNSGAVLSQINGASSCHEKIISPGDVLSMLDREYPMERFNKHFTITYLVLDERTGRVCYSSAAHPMPVMIRADGEIELLEKGGTIIGMGGAVPFEEGRADMKHGDRLFLYTDGLTEYENRGGDLYGRERFYDDLVRYQDYPLDATCECIIKSLMNHGGGFQPRDDITLLGIEYQQP